MKRKNSSFYTKCQSNIRHKKSFLRNVTHFPIHSFNLQIFKEFYQKVALITNFIVCMAARSETVLPS